MPFALPFAGPLEGRGGGFGGGAFVRYCGSGAAVHGLAVRGRPPDKRCC